MENMNNQIEIKGKNNALKVVSLLLDSGYSVHMPFMNHDEPEKVNENYYIIEYSFCKYGEPDFVIEKEI